MTETTNSNPKFIMCVNRFSVTMIYAMAVPFIIDSAILSLHALMCRCANDSGKLIERKSANMHVKTPQSNPINVND
jgi:hypothetical protein